MVRVGGSNQRFIVLPHHLGYTVLCIGLCISKKSGYKKIFSLFFLQERWKNMLTHTNELIQEILNILLDTLTILVDLLLLLKRNALLEKRLLKSLK
nr:hypothetical protein [Cressdnaviricota sp.]